MAPPVVTIKQGQLRGNLRTNLDGDNFYSFVGIPYAKPPVGELRFKAPVPAEPWTGVRDATVEGDCCYSKHEMTGVVEGSEDCLNLNVFTKELPSSSGKLRPVMVYIHGGGYVVGSNRTEISGPEFLMIEDIVLVVINYRLGIVGFLCLEDVSLGVPGNAGLKDQVLALKWVQENIKQFNGDPNNVTIFGESAGSSSVHLHVISESSKGLFHKAILQSGSALNAWVFGSYVAKEIAKRLGHDVKDEKEAFDIIKKTSIEQLHNVREQMEVMITSSQHRPVCPIIEPPNETAFLTKNVIDHITSGKYNKVPMLFGYNTKEGMYLELLEKLIVEKKMDRTVQAFIEACIPWQVHLEKGTEIYEMVCKKIKDLYFKGDDDQDSQFNLLTDSWFLSGIAAAIKNHVATSEINVYLYRMSLEAGLNYIKNLGDLHHLRGASHSDDLGYLFKNFMTPEVKPGSLEDISVRRFVKLWTNFAKYGNPTPQKEEFGIVWKPVKEGEINFLDIGEELTLGVNPEAERIALWKEIYQLCPETSKFL